MITDHYKLIAEFGCPQLSKCAIDFTIRRFRRHNAFAILNADTARMEEQLRLEFFPLSRKERYGPEWQLVHCVIFIRKYPLKFDVSDESEKRTSYHLLETNSEDELIDWLTDQMEAYEA